MAGNDALQEARLVVMATLGGNGSGNGKHGDYSSPRDHVIFKQEVSEGDDEFFALYIVLHEMTAVEAAVVACGCMCLYVYLCVFMCLYVFVCVRM